MLLHSTTHYSGEMCGLCGDADGNDTNDWTQHDGTVVPYEPDPYEPNEFGESWRVLSDDGW